ncbi:hypothetical protein ACFX1X_008731 [Malus domestica]
MKNVFPPPATRDNKNEEKGKTANSVRIPKKAQKREEIEGAPSRPIFFIDPTRPDPTPPSSQRRHDYHGNYEPAIHLFLFVFFCWVFVLMICS